MLSRLQHPQAAPSAGNSIAKRSHSCRVIVCKAAGSNRDATSKSRRQTLQQSAALLTSFLIVGKAQGEYRLLWVDSSNKTICFHNGAPGTKHLTSSNVRHSSDNSHPTSVWWWCAPHSHISSLALQAHYALLLKCTTQKATPHQYTCSQQQLCQVKKHASL